VIPRPRQCMSDEFACGDGECILLEYRCDNRADCRDMSDETGCDLQTLAPQVKTPTPVIPATTVRPVITPRPLPPHTTPRNGLPGPLKPSPSRPCRVDEAVCQSGQCILRDYLCDGERDCGDGSDELNCGTPSPCEPNEFKCRNGRCALKLWRCDGDNDCGDNSDEEYCPTKGPGDTCAPDQFICVTDRVCIPASYQCDEEADCSDRSDEYGCTPPQVTSPPEETITAVRGETVTFSCSAVGVPTPIITWRLNWGHIPASARITMSSKNGQGTLVIRDVKDADQGAYTCPCPGGHFSIESNSRCVSCFCFGITKSCQRARRYRNQIRLRFTEEDDFKGVNVSLPSKPVSPPLTSSQILINPEMEEFQLLDLSRRFLNLESFWTLPNQFLGNKIDSYGGTLKYKVRYTLARGQTEPEDRPDVVIVGNGQKLIYRRRKPTPPNVVNQQEIQFTEENWEHESGAPVSRGDLMMTLVNLEGINIRTVYDNKMVSVGLSDIVMDTTTVEYTNQGPALSVEECRCPPGYTGLSCESCAADFERVSGGAFLGSCAGCNCNGHASTCDPVGGRCLSCQHNTEGPQCDKCRPGFFGDPTRGRPDDCKPCPCPYTETTRRFSATCFLDTDGLATCDACSPGYTGRRCEKCAAGYDGNPLQPGGKCIPSNSISKCDNRGTVSPTSRHCLCKPNVVGTLCDECKTGFFHLKQDNPDGCLQCFCMGVTKQCASSSWNREQVRAADNGQEFTLSNSANTRTISEGIILQSSSELTFRSFSEHPTDVYYWVLPERFRGDKVTSYGGELQYTVLYNPRPGSPTVQGKPDVTLQGNGIFLEHFSDITPIPGVPTTITVPFRESAWRRADGQPSTREHLLMALADTSLFMIRATYADRMTKSSISNIHMDIAVPYPTGQERAAEVEDCACPPGYRGPSCQDCDVGYVRTGSGLYLGTCERCNCNGHSSECDLETGECQQCQHNTAGPHCEICKPGFYGDPKDGSPEACRPCPCPGTSPSTQFSLTCFLDTDGQPTCDNCPASYAGRRCERHVDICPELLRIGKLDDLIPVNCSEAVYNYSEEKQILEDLSGDGSFDETYVVINNTAFPVDASGAKIESTSKCVLFTTIQSVIPELRITMTVAVPTTASNIPLLDLPTPKTRRRDFQSLIRASLNSFNRRMTMLEDNGIEMKDNLKAVKIKQDYLSSQLKTLTEMLSPSKKQDKIAELQKSHADLDARLSKLESKFEILIDGFTVLAEEISDLKRARSSRRNDWSHISARPLISTVPVTTPSTTKPIMKTPKLTTQSHKRLTVTKVQITLSRITTVSPLRPLRTTTKAATILPPKKLHNNYKPNITAKPKSEQQIVPPTTKAKTVTKVPQKLSTTRPKSPPKPLVTQRIHNISKKTVKPTAATKPSTKKRQVIKTTLVVTKPPVLKKPFTKASRQKSAWSRETGEDYSMGRPLPSPPVKRKVKHGLPTTGTVKTTISKNHLNSNGNGHTGKHPSTKKKKQPKQNSNAVDLLKLLQGLQSPKKRQQKQPSLHILLGRLAIPVKIIPDY
ncbi:UNVERIFIED_CONTAM: hypothetical protein FKN15_077797, partial [Acipenser sinensis]